MKITLASDGFPAFCVRLPDGRLVVESLAPTQNEARIWAIGRSMALSKMCGLPGDEDASWEALQAAGARIVVLSMARPRPRAQEQPQAVPGLVTGTDPPVPKPVKTTGGITEKQMAFIYNLLERLGVSAVTTALEDRGFPETLLEDLSPREASRLIDILKSEIGFR